MRGRLLKRVSLGLFCLWIWPAMLWGNAEGLESGYLSVTGPCGFSFPEDHGTHPGYQTEWWYYTGNLHAAGGRPFGFQLTFFRRQIVPPGAETGWPLQPSAWRARNLFAVHMALSDIEAGRFYWDEDIVREAAGLAGVLETNGAIEVFLGRGKAAIGEEHRLTAITKSFSLDLTCSPLKPPIAHGREGYSQKGMKPESASCYYSITRMGTSGRICVHGKTYDVKGTAWMDHEYSTAPLETSLSGWDWFSLQFADHTELMLYSLREKGGSWSPASSGTFVPSAGAARHLCSDDFRVDVMDRWRSTYSGAVYPCRWRVQIPSLDIDIEIFPRLGDQELRLSRSMKVSYWEGSVGIKGYKAQRPIQGVGYVELTGYAAPFDLLGED